MPKPETPTRSISLRLKLTLWMVLIFLVVQLSLGFVYQLYQRQSINDFFFQRLCDRVQLVGGELGPLIPAMSNDELGRRAREYQRILFQPMVYIEIFREDGASISRSEGPGHTLPRPELDAVLREPNPVEVAMPDWFSPRSDAGPGRAAASIVRGGDDRKYILMFGWSDRFSQEMLRLLSGVLFFSIPIGVVAVGISAYVISGVAVQPIRAMRHMARGLEPEFLGERVPMAGSGMEVAELQQSLERTRLKLEAAFSTQERFMSNVSHELKTPIAVLMTEAQTLHLDDAPRPIRAFVESTMDELDKLGRMVDSFLLLTRVRHGKAVVPNQDFFMIRDIMVESFEGCASMASQYGVRISLRLPEGEYEDAAVRGNGDLLRTVLDNLIRNAIRFNPKDTAVHVEGTADGERVYIRVRDQGPGIPEELLPRIFDRFAQSTEEQRRGRGHGLGLEIAMGITELHGGSITVVNRPEGGCEFTVALPMVPLRSAPPAPTPEADPSRQ